MSYFSGSTVHLYPQPSTLQHVNACTVHYECLCFETYVVKLVRLLKKSGQGIGLRIGSNSNGVFVKHIYAGGPADVDGQLETGMIEDFVLMCSVLNLFLWGHGRRGGGGGGGEGRGRRRRRRRGGEGKGEEEEEGRGGEGGGGGGGGGR